MKRFETKILNVKKIFEEKYKIPEYQRNYKWDKDNVAEYFDDLRSESAKLKPILSSMIDSQGDPKTFSIEAKKIKDYKCHFKYDGKTDGIEYGNYLGNMVLVDNDDRTDIIDGQQRFTTTLIFMRAFYDIFMNNEVTFNQELRVLKKIFIETIDGDEDDHEDFKLISQERYRNNYRFLVDRCTNANNTDKRKTLFKNYIVANNLISGESNLEQRNIFWTLYEYTFFNVQQVDTDENVFILFERLNDRGLQLNSSDLIKNWLIMRESKDKRGKLAKSWTTISEDINDNALTTVVCRTLILKEHDKQFTNPEIYTVFKETIGLLSVDKIVKKLQSSADAYRNLKNYKTNTLFDNNDRANIFTIKNMTKKVFDPLLISVIQTGKKEIISRTLESIAVFSVNYFGVHSGFSNKFQAKMHTIIVDFLAGASTSKPLEDAMKIYGKQTNEFETLLSIDVNKKTNNVAKSVLSKILARIITNDSNILKDKIIDFDKIHLEHVKPQSSERWEFEPDHHDSIYEVGNLILLGGKDNIIQSNKPWSQKKKHLTKDLKDIDKVLVNKLLLSETSVQNIEKWDNSFISKRTSEIKRFVVDNKIFDIES